MSKDIETKIQELEEKTKRLEADNALLAARAQYSQPHMQAEDEIDLKELWNVIWAGKWIIIAVTFVFAVASVFYALSLPNMYKSEMILAPAQSESGGLSGLASQYSGLAAIAGINIGGGESSRIEQAVKLAKSWPFLESFINKYDLKPQIMAVKGWNKKNNGLIYDLDIYDPKNKIWTREVKEGEEPEPSSWKSYRALNEMIGISNDTKSGMLTIAVEHYSPQIAFDWVNLLKKELNDFYQTQDMQEAQKNINYLKAKIDETNITEMQTVFYSMIENQTQTLMLAEVSDQYLIQAVVPAKVPELKSKPKRGLVCVVGVMLGGIIGLAAVLLSSFFLNTKYRSKIRSSK